MAKQTLPTNFQDDIMNSSMNGKRRYRQINNADGTVSFEDVTSYDQVGSDFGSAQLNATNKAVNESVDKSKVIDDVDVIAALVQSGYIAGALALKEVLSKLGGCWIEFADAEGNPTTEPYLHYYVEVPDEEPVQKAEELG